MDKAIALDIKAGEALPLMETFYTLQGEGYHKGAAAFFIRIGGCDVGCHWCDVKESWIPEIHPATPITKIVGQAKEYSKTVVVTGGEPLMWNMDPLTFRLKAEGMKIHIETSGVNSISGSYDWITLSPKRHSPPKNYFLKNCNEIKIIINETKDIEFAIQIKKETLKQLSKSEDGLKKKDKVFYLQPAWNNANGFSLAIDFVKNNPDWKLSLQTHKYLKIN